MSKPPIRSAGMGSTARWAASAMLRAVASCSPLRLTRRLLSTARRAQVRMVSSSVVESTPPSVPVCHWRSTTTASARTPVSTVPRSEKNGAAISGAAA